MPSTSTDLLNGLSTSTAVKAPVKAATSENITLSGEQTVNSIAVVSGDRVLVKDQTNAAENGIYIVSSGTWTRAPDWDGQRDARCGTLIIQAAGEGATLYQLTTTDPIVIGTNPVSFTELIISEGGGGGGDGWTGWAQTATEATAGVTPTNLFYPPFDVRRYGASAAGTSTANHTAIQTALNLAYSAGGGTVIFGSGDNYSINASLVMGGDFVNIDGNGAKLTMTIDNEPIILMNKAAYNHHLAVRDLDMTWTNQQTASHPTSYGVQLSDQATITWHVLLENVNVKGGHGAVILPELTGCTAFLCNFYNVTADDCSGWAFDIVGDVSGARTNFNFQSCWAVNTDGAEISTSGGFRIKRTHGVVLDNCGCDHIQTGPFLFCETSQGRIGTFWAESCELSASSGITSYFHWSNSDFTADLLYADVNTISHSGSADHYAIYPYGSSSVQIGLFHDYNSSFSTSGTGAYYAAGVDAGSRVSVFDYSSNGATPAAAFVDPNVPTAITPWNGVSRETGVIALTLSDGTNSTNTNVVYTKSGNLVHLKFNATYIAYTGTGFLYLSGLPAGLYAARFQSNIVRVRSGTTELSLSDQVGIYEILPDDDTINLYRDVAGSTTWPAYSGISNASLTYSLV